MHPSLSQHKSLAVFAAFALALVLATRLWPLPKTLVLPVPFTDQAPTGKWDRNEDCEETSIAMAQAYLTGDTEDQIPAAGAQAYINKLRAWEAANIGYNANTGAYATSSMAEGTFGLTVQQIKNYTETDLKKALASHHVVLLPINARLLGNPSYLDSGPLYHMIVIRGYTADGFVVNDPGTSEGNADVYPYATLIGAAADWNNAAQSMDPTIKIALVLSK